MKKVSKNFYDVEFLPEEIYKEYGEKSINIFIDPLLPKIAQFIRERYETPLFINTWSFKGSPIGSFNYSGYRPFDCGVGAKNSQHKFGRAIDVKIPGMDLKEVMDDMKSNNGLFRSKGISTTYLGNGFVHIDVRNTMTDKIVYI